MSTRSKCVLLIVIFSYCSSQAAESEHERAKGWDAAKRSVTSHASSVSSDLVSKGASAAQWLKQSVQHVAPSLRGTGGDQVKEGPTAQALTQHEENPTEHVATAQESYVGQQTYKVRSWMAAKLAQSSQALRAGAGADHIPHAATCAHYSNGDQMTEQLEYVALPGAVKDMVRKLWADKLKDAAGKAIVFK